MERAPCSGLALRPQLSTVSLDDATCDEQAQTEPASVAMRVDSASGVMICVGTAPFPIGTEPYQLKTRSPVRDRFSSKKFG